MMETGVHSKPPIRIKIISMGNAEVGKSCIIKRYCEKRFVSKYLATIGIDYGVTRLTCKNRDVKVNIFDMAGQSYFYEIRNEFYSDTQGVILVYDVTNKSTFDALDSWMEEIRNELSNVSEIDNIVFVVCANKTDKKRIVDASDGRLWADAHGFQYFEVSALSGDGVTEMFQEYGRRYLARQADSQKFTLDIVWTYLDLDLRPLRHHCAPQQLFHHHFPLYTILSRNNSLALFDGVVAAVENGGRRLPTSTNLTYTREQAEAIQRLKNAKDDHQRLGLPQTATVDDVNKAFRKLSVLLHPDKSLAPGSEEAFKILVAARTSLLKQITR